MLFQAQGIQAGTDNKAASITSDGYLELSSDSASLKKGDTVEVKLYWHYDTTPVYGIFIDLAYDEEILEPFTAAAVSMDEIDKWYVYYVPYAPDTPEEEIPYGIDGSLNISYNQADGTPLPEDGCWFSMN